MENCPWTNVTCYRWPIKMLLEPGVRLGVSSRPSSKRRNRRVQRSMLALSKIIVRRSRPSSRKCVRMCLTSSAILSSLRLNPGSQKSFIIKCKRLSDLYAKMVDLAIKKLMSYYRKGDYHRYLAEFASGEKRKFAATAAHDAYKVRFKYRSKYNLPSGTNNRFRTPPTLLRLN